MQNIFLIFLLFFFTNTLQALPINNMSFENELAGWETMGNISTTTFTVSNDGNVYFATEGDYFASIKTNGNYLTNNFNGTNGSVLKTDINILAGQIFQFDWAFLTNDYVPYNDFALFIGEDIVNLSDVNLVGNHGSIEWKNFNWTPSEDYVGTVSFIVSNAVDNSVTSTLLIENIKIASIEEPGLFTLLSIGFLLIYFSKSTIRPPTFG